MTRALGIVTGAALPALLAGCVYFNTFYNAENYYAEGERLVRAEGVEGEIPPAARTAFEKAAQKASTVVASHPDSKYADDALLLLGKAHERLGNHAEAAVAFQALLQEHPISELRGDATLWLARSARAAGDLEAAEGAIARLGSADELEREERFQLELERARIALDRGDGDRAVELFGELQEREPELARRHDVDLLAARARLAEGDGPGALRQLRGVLAEATSPVRQRRAAEAMAEVLAASGSGPAAREAYRDLLQQGLPDSLAASVQAALAASHESAGENEEAAEAYAAAARLLPASPLAAHALYRRGLIQWRAQGERGPARETFLEAFLEAPQSPPADSAAQAARTIAEIEHYAGILSGAERVPSPLPAEEVQATAAYLLAELLYTAEGDEAGARELFERMLVEYPRSRWTPKVLYTLGWLDAGANGSAAATPYDERLLREFPDTQYALYARQRRGGETAAVIPAPTGDAAPGAAPGPTAAAGVAGAPAQLPPLESPAVAGSLEVASAAPDSVDLAGPAGPAPAPLDSLDLDRPRGILALPAEGRTVGPAAAPAPGSVLALPSTRGGAASSDESLDATLLAFTRALPRPPDPLLGIQDRLLARERARADGGREGSALAAEIERERAAGQALADSVGAANPDAEAPPPADPGDGGDVLQGEQRPEIPQDRPM